MIICVMPKVKGGSGTANICGGDIIAINHTRENSRDLHTNWHCPRCKTSWTGEEWALMQVRLANQYVARVKGPHSNELNELGTRMERLLTQAQMPTTVETLSADESDRVGPFH
jgi:hypothetical protein